MQFFMYDPHKFELLVHLCSDTQSLDHANNKCLNYCKGLVNIHLVQIGEIAMATLDMIWY